jgi:protein subunit release factor B
MIKDLRTLYETSNVVAVLDGDLDGFIMESLSQRVTGGNQLLTHI